MICLSSMHTLSNILWQALWAGLYAVSALQDAATIPLAKVNGGTIFLSPEIIPNYR
jgi:hypothetical protein